MSTQLEDLDFLPVSAVAKVFRSHPETIRNWIKAGILPAFSTAGITRILRSDVEDLIRQRTSSKRVG